MSNDSRYWGFEENGKTNCRSQGNEKWRVGCMLTYRKSIRL